MELLNAQHISVSLGHTSILNDCSLTVRPGEFIAIIGPNGAGKSTLLKALRSLIPRTGSVSLTGRPESELSEKDRARLIAFMQQDFHVSFGYSCEDIVLSARYPYLSWWQGESEKDKEIAQRAMAFTGVSHLAHKDIQSVSGGERQRVLLAKVLAQEAPLLFLDEPTAALDLLYQEEIFRLCHRLAGDGKSILMVCHDLTAAARWANRLLLVAHGTILADGTPEEVFTERNLEHAFGLHSIVYTNPISGALDLYVYPKPITKGKRVLVLGSGLVTAALIRKLYTAGYAVQCGYLPEGTLAREAAKDFHVPYRPSPQGLPAASGPILAYGLTEEERGVYQPLLRSGQPLYTDTPEPGGTVLSLETMTDRIQKGLL